MDILEHYLDAVAAQLPKDNRDDIVAELRDMLLTRFEGEEARRGRPLTDDEREDILRETGHPLVVAARYRKGPQHLIGPELFPYWLFGVKAGLAVMAAIHVLVLLINVGGGTPDAGRAIAQAFHGFINSGLTVIGLLTVVGAILEHSGIRPAYLDRWRVKDLAVLRLSDPANWAAEAATEPSGRSRAYGVRLRGNERAEPLAGAVAGAIFILWWIGVLHFPGLMRVGLDGGDALITPGPVWTTMHNTILLYAVALVAIDVSRLLQPGLRRVQASLSIAVAGWGLWITWAVFQAGHWFTLTADGERVTVAGDGYLPNLDRLQALSAASHDTLPAVGQVLGVVMAWGLAFVALGLVIRILKNLWRLLGPTGR